MLHRMPYFSNFMHRDGSSLDGCKYTIECRVAYIHRKPLQMHIYERQTHLQTRFQCQLTKPSRSSMGSAARGRRCFFTSATKLCHQIEFFVNVSKWMIGKEHKRCNFVWGLIVWDEFGAKILHFQLALLLVDWPGQLNLWWNLTIECRVEYINQKPLQMNNYKCQNHLQTRF